MMKKDIIKWGTVFVFGLTLNQGVFAEESSTAAPSSSTESLKGVFKNKQFEDTKTLTDPALKTSDGSLSRYSFKGSMSYSGPTLSNLSAQNQPNPDGTNGNYAQRISGSVTANYRFTSTTSMSGGTGLTDNYPFGGNPNVTTNNPFIAYNMADRWGNLQMRNSPEAIYTTDPTYLNPGEVGGLKWYNGFVYSFEQSSWSVSMDTTAYLWIFGRAYNTAPKSKGGDAKYATLQSYVLNWKPGAKYNFTDRLVAYSTINLEVYNPRNGTGDNNVIWHRAVGTSLGVGYAHNRDIYFSPYITTYPWAGAGNNQDPNFSDTETTINFSTTFSLL